MIGRPEWLCRLSTQNVYLGSRAKFLCLSHHSSPSMQVQVQLPRTRSNFLHARGKEKAKAILFLPLTAPIALTSQAIRYARKRYWKYQKTQEDAKGRVPPPLIERERALSFSNSSNHVKNSEVAVSNLYRLPTEIRLHIFQYLIEPNCGVHILFIDGTLYSYRCLYQDSDYLPTNELHRDCKSSLSSMTQLLWKKAPPVFKHAAKLGVLGYLHSSRVM